MICGSISAQELLLLLWLNSAEDDDAAAPVAVAICALGDTPLSTSPPLSYESLLAALRGGDFVDEVDAPPLEDENIENGLLNAALLLSLSLLASDLKPCNRVSSIGTRVLFLSLEMNRYSSR